MLEFTFFDWIVDELWDSLFRQIKLIDNYCELGAIKVTCGAVLHLIMIAYFYFFECTWFTYEFYIPNNYAKLRHPEKNHKNSSQNATRLPTIFVSNLNSQLINRTRILDYIFRGM